MARVALVGTGVVGSSWAVVFARAGYDVVLSDPDPEAGRKADEFVRYFIGNLATQDGMSGDDAQTILARIKQVPDLEEALDGVDYVQESGPERLDVKKALFERLDRLTSESIILASSSSGLPASKFTEGLIHRERCVIAHPINPPHLIPLVEVVPAPWTESSVIHRVMTLMTDLGQSPIQLQTEINGFVVNRLQSAILGEAFRLVEDNICSAEEVDRAMSIGLGRRWFFMGPFQTIDLNASGGIAEYCRNLGPMYLELAREQSDPRPWSDELVARIEAELRNEVSAPELVERRVWRDHNLARLARFQVDD